MTEAHPLVERYLAKLAEGLGALTPPDRAEIVQEIRHHVDDAVAAGRPLDAVLESLGSAETLARAYAVESLLHPRPNERPNRIGRFFKIAGLVASAGAGFAIGQKSGSAAGVVGGAASGFAVAGPWGALAGGVLEREVVVEDHAELEHPEQQHHRHPHDERV